MLLETSVQLEMDPPVTKTSDSMKLVDGSEREKVSVALSPAFKEEISELTEIEGGVVSLIVESVACVAELPAKSLTSAVMVSVPSLRDERSRFETE